MKIVFAMAELAEIIEEGATEAFEAQGGVVGDQTLMLTSFNADTQELLFTISEPANETIDLSPTVTDESLPDA